MNNTRFYLNETSRLIRELPDDQIERIVARLTECWHNGGQLFLCGNGGSAATCSHILADFTKCLYLASGRTWRALAVTDSIPLITAWANDTSYDNVFSEQLRPWIGTGDILLALSGSGNSPNVLLAVELAKEQGACTIGLAGYQGGKLAPLCDECIIVPCDNMQRIEDCHMVLVHVLFWTMLQEAEAATPSATPAG